ncbi:MAG: PspC domain-containing protein [Candidatus Marinimicrobia bacterium]|nr:PspC domain-containing protein [Candidatus Neomarinimicrobiota bacterium]
MSNQKLERSLDERMFVGVLGGLADYLGWDVTILRILYVVVTLFSSVFPGVILYIILWILMPEKLDNN